MISPFYMKVGVTENLINPQIKLDGKWEVALCDLSLITSSLNIGGGDVTTATTSGFRKIKKSDFQTPLNLFMMIKIQVAENRLLRMKAEGGINNIETDRLKEAWKRYKYGNNTQYGIQSSQFDKWMNDLKFEEFHHNRPTWIVVRSRDILSLWGEDPDKEISLEELLTRINADIRGQEASIKYYIRILFKNNDEALKLLESPYYSVPEFNYKNGYISLKTPYYVSAVWVSQDFARLIKLDTFGEDYLSLKPIFKRVRFQVPNFLSGTYYWRISEYEGREYQFQTENYFINTPCRKIVSYLPGETTTTTTTVADNTILFNVKVDGGVLEETRIGSKFDSILRLVWIEKGEIYKQFQHRIYVPLRYDTLNNFNIRVINTTNNRRVVNGFVILHFRKRYE